MFSEKVRVRRKVSNRIQALNGREGEELRIWVLERNIRAEIHKEREISGVDMESRRNLEYIFVGERGE